MDTSDHSPASPASAGIDDSQNAAPFQFNQNASRLVANGQPRLDFFHNNSVPSPPPLPKSGTLPRRGTPANIASQSFFHTQPTTAALDGATHFPTNTNHNRLAAMAASPQGSPLNMSAVHSPQSPDSPAVNDRSINPEEIRAQVSRFLINRPPKAHLVDRHLMAPDNIPNQHFQTVEKLEKQHRSDSLNHMLRARPSREALLQRGIMHDDEKRQYVTETLREKLEKRPGAMDVMEKGYFYPYGTAKQPKKFVFHKMIWENGQMKKTTDPKSIQSGGPTRRQRSRPSSRNSSKTSLVDHFQEHVNDEHVKKLIQQQERYLQIEEAANKMPIPPYVEYIETGTQKMSISDQHPGEVVPGRIPSPVSSITGGLRTIGEKSHIPDPPGPPPKFTAKSVRRSSSSILGVGGKRHSGRAGWATGRRSGAGSRRESICAPLEFTQECLHRETVEELKNQCKWANLPIPRQPRKADLIERLIDYHGKQQERDRKIEELARENAMLKRRLVSEFVPPTPVIHTKMKSEPNSPINRPSRASGATTPVLDGNGYMPSNGNFLTPQYSFISPQAGPSTSRGAMAESIPSIDSGVDDSRPRPISLGSSQASIPTTEGHLVNTIPPYPTSFPNFSQPVLASPMHRSYEYPPAGFMPAPQQHALQRPGYRSRPTTPHGAATAAAPGEMDTSSPPTAPIPPQQHAVTSQNTLEACIGQPMPSSPLLHCSLTARNGQVDDPTVPVFYYDQSQFQHTPPQSNFSNVSTSMHPALALSSRSSSRASLNQIPGSMYSSTSLLDQGQHHNTPLYSTLGSHPIYRSRQDYNDRDALGASGPPYHLVVPEAMAHETHMPGETFWLPGATATEDGGPPTPAQQILLDRHRHPPHHYMPYNSAPKPLPYAPPEVFALRESKRQASGNSTESANSNFNYPSPAGDVIQQPPLVTQQHESSASISVPSSIRQSTHHPNNNTTPFASSFLNQSNQQLSTSASTITNVPVHHRSITPVRQQPTMTNRHAVSQPQLNLLDGTSPPHDMHSVADLVMTIEQNLSSTDNVSHAS